MADTVTTSAGASSVAPTASGEGVPSSGTPPPKAAIISRPEKWAIYAFLAAVIVVVGVMQANDASSQSAKYDKIMSSAQDGFTQGKISEANYLLLETSVSPVQDTLSLRHAGLFFGIVIIGLGCMLVLTGIETGYQLTIDSNAAKGSFNTASPGLVLITLGVVLAIAALYKSTTLDFVPYTEAATVVAPPVVRTATNPAPTLPMKLPGEPTTPTVPTTTSATTPSSTPSVDPVTTDTPRTHLETSPNTHRGNR